MTKKENTPIPLNTTGEDDRVHLEKLRPTLFEYTKIHRSSTPTILCEQ
jgi:hypothetical protein